MSMNVTRRSDVLVLAGTDIHPQAERALYFTAQM